MTSALIDRRDLLFLALIAVLPLLGYQFGLGNQVEQFSIIRRLLDPAFLPADFYVNSASGFGPRYYYALCLASLTRLAPFPLVILFLTVLTNFALAMITFDAARRHLHAARRGAAIAALLVIVNSSFSLGLAGFIRFESFQPANIAIPLALGGLSAMAAERSFMAALAFAASAIFHPLIGVETAMIGFASAAGASLLGRRPVISLLRFVPAGLVFSAIILLAWAAPSLGDSSPQISDAEFFSILPTFRAPHHYLAASFPAAHYFTAAMFVASSAFLVLRRRWHEGTNNAETTLALAALLIIAACAASYVLVDVMHDRVFTAAQVFRDLLILKWIGFLFFGWAAGEWLKRPELIFAVAVFAPVFATGEAQPLALAAAIGALSAFGASGDDRRAGFVLSALLAVFALAVAYKAGVREEMARAVLGVGVFWMFYQARLKMAPLAGAVVIGAIGAFGYWNKDARIVEVDIVLPKYSWADIKDDDAVIARWVKDNTPAEAVFATPPDFERFRLLGERAVVADYTSIPFDEMAMREWRRRMGVLYGEVKGGGFKALRAMDKNYHALTPSELRARTAAFNADYAVIYASTPWPDAALYEHGAYKVVRLAPPSK
ncbi:MAG: hypothetical protein KDA46_14745 [Parvularculaceae bacterium]|nr:hypothetical protein [Parvularculaceae bacterium]